MWNVSDKSNEKATTVEWTKFNGYIQIHGGMKIIIKKVAISDCTRRQSSFNTIFMWSLLLLHHHRSFPTQNYRRIPVNTSAFTSKIYTKL